MNKMLTLTDNLLLCEMQQGKKSAFDEIFRKYYPVLCAYSNRFVRLEDAEEIVQDVMLWLWENRKVLFVETSLSGYLFKTVYHRTINKMLKDEVRQRADTFFYQKMQNLYIETDGGHLEELLEQIERAVNKLPDSYGESFRMHRFQQMDYKEIAKVLNVSPKTIDYRIRQALKLLRKELRDYLPFF